MSRMMRLQKGQPTWCCCVGRKVKKKCIDRKQREDAASESIGEDRGAIRRSACYFPETRRWIQQMMNSRSGIGPHRWRGAQKRGLTKASLTVSLFCHFANIITAVVCLTISPYELVCILYTISPYLLHHFTIMKWRYLFLHHFITVFHHFTMWTFCILCTISPYAFHHSTIIRRKRILLQHYTISPLVIILLPIPYFHIKET